MIRYDRIVKDRIEIGADNRQHVFDAVRALMNSELRGTKGKVRLEDIRKYIEEKIELENKNLKGILHGITNKDKDKDKDNDSIRFDVEEKFREQKKTAMSIRTIRRCIVADPRIKKQGWYFFIDDEARFEKRYGLHPEDTGSQVYRSFRDEMDIHHYNNNDSRRVPLIEEMRNMVTEMGYFLVYSLIEACKPFRDKSLSVDEREDLVKYWIKKWVPILGQRGMLEDFLSISSLIFLIPTIIKSKQERKDYLLSKLMKQR